MEEETKNSKSKAYGEGKYIRYKTNMLQKECAKNVVSRKGITLIALIITILFSYDEMIKFSNSKGFLLATI